VDLAQMSAEEVIAALELEYLEGEGCWISLLWRTERANAIYVLITPEDFSAMHRLVEDEAWTFIAGAPAQVLVLHPGGEHESLTLGTDIAAGHVPHHRIPAHTWQGTVTLGSWTLASCVLAPAFTSFELATASTDFSPWSQVSSLIAQRMREDR
jgi:predicted cupin superfamily sugar epimerase